LHAVVVAIDKLLLREDRELLLGNVVDTLGVAADAECPAGAAGALVLDRGDSTVLDPVLGLRPVAELGVGGRKEVALHARDIDLVEVLAGELLNREISKLVHAETGTLGVAAIEGIELGGTLLVLDKDLKALLVLSRLP